MASLGWFRGERVKWSNFAVVLLYMSKDWLSKTSGCQFHKWLFRPEKFSGLLRNEPQASVVQKADNTIHWINHYPADKH